MSNKTIRSLLQNCNDKRCQEELISRIQNDDKEVKSHPKILFEIIQKSNLYYSNKDETNNFLLNIFQLLISKGVNLNEVDEFGNTIIFYVLGSIKYISKKLPRLLLKNGANIYFVKNRNGDLSTVLMMMLINHWDKDIDIERGIKRSMEFINYIIDTLPGSDDYFGIKDSGGYNALMYAISNKYISEEIIFRLLDKTCNINACTSYGGTALYFALKNFRIRKNIIVPLICRKADINVKLHNGTTLLMTLLDNESDIGKYTVDLGSEYINIAEYLIKNCNNINDQDGNGDTVCIRVMDNNIIPGNLIIKIINKTTNLKAKNKDGVDVYKNLDKRIYRFQVCKYDNTENYEVDIQLRRKTNYLIKTYVCIRDFCGHVFREK